MEIRQISYILTMVEMKNMTKAAAALHISQSALSQAYKSIEAETGLTLFRKEGRSLVLTEDGKYFVEQGRPLVAQMELFEKNLALRQKQESFRIRYFTDVVDNCDETMIQFQNFYPETVFEREYYDSEKDLIEGLLKEEVDLALSLRVIDCKGLVCEKLIDEPVVMLMHPDHSLAKKESISINEMDGEVLTIYQNAASLRALFLEFFALGNAAPSKVMEVYDPFIQIQNQNGLIFMPESTYYYFKKYNRLGNLVGIRVSDDFCRRRVFLTYKKGRRQGRLIQGYFEYLKIYHRISVEERCLPEIGRFHHDDKYHVSCSEKKAGRNK